jgi:hypothetical protein
MLVDLFHVVQYEHQWRAFEKKLMEHSSSIKGVAFHDKKMRCSYLRWVLIHEIIWLFVQLPITVAARSRAWTVFARSNTGIVVSNPARGMYVCVRLFCVQLAALRPADPPSKESYRLYKRSRNWKSGQGPTKGCRAIDRFVQLSVLIWYLSHLTSLVS